MAKQEMVLATRAADFKAKLSDSKGFIDVTSNEQLAELFPSSSVILGSREWLEDSPEWLQFIGYIVVRNQEGKILAYLRTPNGGENRLHDKSSVAFGGHVGLTDVVFDEANNEVLDISKTLQLSIYRELHEELGITDTHFIIHGLLWDFNDEVGLVHIGLLGEVTVNQEDFKVEDSAKLLGFFDRDELFQLNLEAWSRVALDILK
jgi:predicted NUDIX family phosphoesterase